MTYNEALEFIYSRRKFQKSSGHERIERLLELLGNPHKKLRFVHVVGTNGKGSVSTALSFILRSAGYNTGLFTSPFVVCFGERIQVNGEYISQKAVASYTKLIKEKLEIMEKEGLNPTVFELTTALAMIYFYEMNCDIVVLEAGIGGSKDSTSVIPPPNLAVITSVSLDHSEVLGSTVEEIAKEKCGIIKGGCAAVSYPFESGSLPFIPQDASALKVIRQKCEEEKSSLNVPNVKEVTLIKSDITGNEFLCGGLHIKTKMCGNFQIGNMLTAITAARVLSENGYFITDENIQRGIEDFFIPGRMECVSSSPYVILDGGHNEGAMREIKKSLEGVERGKTVALCSFMKDKAYKKSLSVICPLFDSMVFTEADPIRGERAEKLKAEAEPYCKDIYCEADLEKAFIKAKEIAGQSGTVIVCGSFYLTSEIRNKFFS